MDSINFQPVSRPFFFWYLFAGIGTGSRRFLYQLLDPLLLKLRYLYAELRVFNFCTRLDQQRHPKLFTCGPPP